MNRPLEISVSLRGDVDKIKSMRERLIPALRRATAWASYELLKQVTLRGRIPVVSGTLRRSWAPLPVKEVKGGFTGGVGSNLVYAPVVEFGYDGPVRAHVRRVRSRDIRGGKSETLTATDRLGRTRTRVRRELLAVGICHVRAHTRRQKERPYARPGLAAASPAIGKLYDEAIKGALTGGGGQP